MGETNKATQDISREGTPSGGEGGTTSQDKAKTYTEEQMQEQVQKRVSDALAAKGRDDKTLTNREASVDAREAAIAEAERIRDAAELEAARYDPDKLRDYQARHAERTRGRTLDQRERDLNKRQAEIDRSKAENEAEVTASRETAYEMALRQVAAQYDIDFEELKKLNLPTIEQAEAVAKQLQAAKGEGGEEGAKEPFTVDSGVTSGRKAPAQGKPSYAVFSEHIAEQAKK